MSIDSNIILNCLIALFFYNMILKSIGATMIKFLLNSEAGKEGSKSFKQKLQDKLDKE